jgi:hypothetical protein
MAVQLTREHFEILDHTLKRAPAGRYCGGSTAMSQLVECGLMQSAGRAQWCPDEFFTITGYGQQVHGEVVRKERELSK